MLQLLQHCATQVCVCSLEYRYYNHWSRSRNQRYERERTRTNNLIKRRAKGRHGEPRYFIINITSTRLCRESRDGIHLGVEGKRMVWWKIQNQIEFARQEQGI